MTGPPPSVARNVADQLRAADDRVPVVERAFLAQRLGLAGDDLELLDESTVTDLLALPSSVVLPIAASRLLARLDAVVARAHPVDLESYHALTVAVVSTGDGAYRAVLEDGRVYLPDGVPIGQTTDDGLTLDDAEALAYALLRLVELGRGGDAS